MTQTGTITTSEIESTGIRWTAEQVATPAVGAGFAGGFAAGYAANWTVFTYTTAAGTLVVTLPITGVVAAGAAAGYIGTKLLQEGYRTFIKKEDSVDIKYSKLKNEVAKDKTDKDAKIAALEKDKTDKDKKITELETEKREQAKEIKKLNDETIPGLNGQITILENEKGKQAKEIKDLKDAKDEQDIKMKKYEERFSLMLQKFDKMSEEQQKQNEQFRNLQAENNNFKEQQKDLFNKIAQLEYANSHSAAQQVRESFAEAERRRRHEQTVTHASNFQPNLNPTQRPSSSVNTSNNQQVSSLTNSVGSDDFEIVQNETNDNKAISPEAIRRSQSNQSNIR